MTIQEKVQRHIEDAQAHAKSALTVLSKKECTLSKDVKRAAQRLLGRAEQELDDAAYAVRTGKVVAVAPREPVSAEDAPLVAAVQGSAVTKPEEAEAPAAVALSDDWGADEIPVPPKAVVEE